MKRNTRKLFSLLLALVMALSLAVPAFAVEGDPPEKELRFAWLQNQGEGFYAEDIVLNSKDNRFEGGLGLSPVGERHVIFFIWNNKTNQRENFVVPKGDGNITVTKLAKDEIAKGSKQSTYYVKLRMNEFKDGEVTANGLSFHVNAMLDDFGFYSAATPSVEAALEGEVEAAKLTGSALYFCATYVGTDEANDHDTISKVERDPNDPNNFYSIEPVKDGVWKLAVTDTGKVMLKQGGIRVNLRFEVEQPDGNTRQDGRSININGEDQGPQLWFVHLNDDWDDEGQQFFFIGENVWAECQTAQVHTGDYAKYGIFGTIKEGQEPFTEKGFNQDAFTPVDVKSLKAPAGLTIESVSDQAKKGEKWGKYFVKVSVAENGKEYKVTSGDYAITISSGLPDIGVYTAPTASFDNWAGEWGFRFHPAHADEPYYIISTATDAKNGQHLVDAKISPDFPGKDEMSLEKVSDSVYKLVFKDVMNRDSFHVEVDLTWTDFMGNTNTEPGHYFGNFDCYTAVLASDTSLIDVSSEDAGLTGGDIVTYASVADKVSTSITMAVGESKDVYLYRSYFFNTTEGEEPAWQVYTTMPLRYQTSDKALTLSVDKKDFSKFTLKADKPGEYTVYLIGGFKGMTILHEDGTEYTEEEKNVLKGDADFLDCDATGTRLVLYKRDKDGNMEPSYYTGDAKYEIRLTPNLDDIPNWYPLTVTVKGEAKPQTANPTNDKLTVNGKEAIPAAYKIDGANYFMLRDLAALLNGTKSQFSIGWDPATNSGTITTGQAYSIQGGELQGKPTASATANLTKDVIYINGQKADLTIYKIGNSNYIQLRDLGRIMNFGLDYQNGTVIIDTTKPYTE